MIQSACVVGCKMQSMLPSPHARPPIVNFDIGSVWAVEWDRAHAHTHVHRTRCRQCNFKWCFMYYFDNVIQQSRQCSGKVSLTYQPPPPPPPSGRGMVMVIADCHTAYALLMHSTLPLRVCMLCHFKSQRREHCLLQQSQYLDCSLFTHQCSCVSYLFGLLVHQQRTDAPHSAIAGRLI